MKTLRRIAITLSALMVVAAPALASTGASESRGISSRAALERSIVGEINALRASRGLRPLALSKALVTSARNHSRDMARGGYFSHVTPSGMSFTDRVRKHYRSTGFRSWRAGENLLWASPDIDAARALELWLKSPRHRKILLRSDWREIGLSAVHTASAPRVYAGLEVTIITANFGARTR